MTTEEFQLRALLWCRIRRRLREEIALLEQCNAAPAPVPTEPHNSFAPNCKGLLKPWASRSWLARFFWL